MGSLDDLSDEDFEKAVEERKKRRASGRRIREYYLTEDEFAREFGFRPSDRNGGDEDGEDGEGQGDEGEGDKAAKAKTPAAPKRRGYFD
jgi:hypothetical protein